ncbi:MAG: response regulator [Herpetosiphonaceae bacterium]|nr:response regulator [Herpetosiphonaceae bacterium]
MPTIMIVEDDWAVSHMLSDVLSDYGYNVVMAFDGFNALQQLDGVEPDLILCDEMMPRMAGHDLCLHLAADDKYRHIPVVMMSARHLESIPAPETCLMFIRKPFSQDDLLNTLIDILGDEPPYLN